MKWFLGIFAVVSLSTWVTLEFVFPRPEGHWHLVMNYDRETGQFENLDFDGNKITAGNVLYEYGGGVDRFRRRIRAWPMCRGFEPNYSFSGDSLILKQDNSRHFALKVDKSKCTKQSHFFETSLLNVDLTEIPDTIEFLRLKKLSLINAIDIGRRKVSESNSVKLCIFGSEKEIGEGDVEWLIEAHKITTSEQYYDNIQLAFYADKETKIKHLKPILQKLTEIPDRPTVVLVFQYNPQPDAFELFGKEIIFEGVDWTKVENEILFSEYVLGQ